MAARVVSLTGIKEENESFGKSVNDLINLIAHGFNTSESFIITQEAFRDFIDTNNLEKKINHLQFLGVPHHIDKHIDNAQLPEDLISEILKEYKKLGTVLEDAEVILNGEKIKGEMSLIEKIRQIFISYFREKKTPVIIIQKSHFGKHGKVRTSSKFINTIHSLNQNEVLIIENMLSKFKSLFYIPHEIDFTLERNRILINRIKPETHVALGKLDVVETDYKIFKNSAI